MSDDKIDLEHIEGLECEMGVLKEYVTRLESDLAAVTADRDRLAATVAELQAKWDIESSPLIPDSQVTILLDAALSDLRRLRATVAELREVLLPIVAWERRRCRKNGVPMLSFYERAAALLSRTQPAATGETK